MKALPRDIDQASNNSLPDPHFPPEIEHKIFVIAFETCIDTKWQNILLTVAKRVSEWLIPRLWDTFLLRDQISGPPKRYPTLTTLQKYGHHVRQLAMTQTWRALPLKGPDLLSSCPNVTNLAFWCGASLTLEVFNLPVTRLAIWDFKFLIEGLKIDLNSDLRFANWCSNITHLAVGSAVGGWNHAYLNPFPALEYLMLSDLDILGRDNTIHHHPRLKVVIRLLGNASRVAETLIIQDAENVDDDIRIVKVDGIFLEDWMRGAKGLGDMWDLAEREVERRRQAMGRDR